jgi:hypothetical protein
VLNVHVRTGDKDDIKVSIYEELEPLFDQFPRYQKKIFQVDFNAKVGSQVIRVYMKSIMIMGSE